MDPKFKSFVINTLRRASYRWIPRNEAKKKAKINRGIYECSTCKKHVRNKEIKMDHKECVVDVKQGFQGFDIYITRLFCDENGFAALCSECHDIKTKAEREERKIYKPKKEKVKRKKK